MGQEHLLVQRWERHCLTRLQTGDKDGANSFSTAVGAVPSTSSQCFPSPCAAEERVAQSVSLLIGAASIPAWGRGSLQPASQAAHHGQGELVYHTRWELPAFMLVSSFFIDFRTFVYIFVYFHYSLYFYRLFLSRFSRLCTSILYNMVSRVYVNLSLQNQLFMSCTLL